MILYVNGDSNCCGTELKDPTKSWPHLLANMLGAQLINDSRAGASNTRILRLTNDFLSDLQAKDVLVIVGTTSWEREEWTHDGQFYNVNSSTKPQILPEKLRDKFRQWVMDQNDHVRALKSNGFHEQFFQLHQRLESSNIKHVFFNGFNPFMDGTDFKSFDKADWNKNFLDPYGMEYCYYWYLKNQGHEPTAGFHHLEDAQAKWAEFLYQYLKDNILS